jgi:hypothetical protein
MRRNEARIPGGLCFFAPKRRFVQGRAAEGIDLLSEFLNGLLVLPQRLSQLVPSVCVTQAADQDPDKEGTQQNHEERNTFFKPLQRENGVKAEAKRDVIGILYREKDDTEKNDHPQKRPDPLHVFLLLSRRFCFFTRSSKTDRSFR